MSQFVPSLRPDVTLPGTAMTSRFSSRASLAVMREPLCREASTTTSPVPSPAMIRFRRGKWNPSGRASSGSSVTTAPVSRIFSASGPFSGG
jgi:hypothetical protein